MLSLNGRHVRLKIRRFVMGADAWGILAGNLSCLATQIAGAVFHGDVPRSV
jgi:hypothetical protein